MQSVIRPLALPLVAGLLAASLSAAAGPAVSPDYRITTPSLALDPDPAPQTTLAGWGPVHLIGAAQGSGSGSGLSLQAGERWFARVAAGRSVLERDVLSVGGGFRFSGTESVSMHLTRALAEDRLGLAVRYDWSRTYLRLSYEQPQHPLGLPERVRFSAGVRW